MKLSALPELLANSRDFLLKAFLNIKDLSEKRSYKNVTVRYTGISPYQV